MKNTWKLIVIALLAALLVCTCMSAMAEDCDHYGADHKTSLMGWETVKAATCTTEGVQYFKCSKCDWRDEAKGENKLPKLAHTEGALTQTKDPTCTEAGEKTVKCTVCGTVLKSESVPALGHEAGIQWTVKTAATCAAPGEEVRHCNRCGKDIETRTIAQLKCAEENLVQIDPAVAPTHTQPGKTARTQCKLCGKYYGGQSIPATGHEKASTKEWQTDPHNAATCTKDGRLVKLCSCGAELDAKTQSKFNHGKKENWIHEVEPSTCTKKGYDRYRCPLCGQVVSGGESPLAAHTLVGVPWVKVSDPTCAKEGKETRTCTVCHEVAESRAIPKTPCGNTYVEIDAAVKNTCEKDGKTATLQCTVCGKIKGGEVVKATGHKTVDVNVVEPNCTEDGHKDVHCTNANCDKKGVVATNVKIPAKGHQGVWKVVTAPTPKAAGLSVKYCKVCDIELERKTVPYTVMLYGNHITSFGPCTRDLIGGTTWNRVTPFEVKDGTFTYDLIASNKYSVGTATVTVAEGKMTVSYKLNSNQFNVTSESLSIYKSKEDLKNGIYSTYTLGTPIDVAEFDGDTKIIIALELIADYDSIGRGVYDMKIDQALLTAMEAIID